MAEDEIQMAKEMGIRLNMMRVRLGFSQGELAKSLGCTQAFVSKWLSGKKIISIKYLHKICQVFEVPWDYFNPDNKKYVEYLESKVPAWPPPDD